jgi:serine protease Do
MSSSQAKHNFSIMWRGVTYEAELIGADPVSRISLARFKFSKEIPFLTWAEVDEIEIGSDLLGIANPFGTRGRVISGVLASIIDDFNPELDIHGSMKYLSSSIVAEPRFLGGPVVDKSGQVVGVMVAISPTDRTVGAITADQAQAIVAQLLEFGRVVYGWLGVRITDVSPDSARLLDLKHSAGALITSVTPDSPAASAGIRQADIITKFGDEDIIRPFDLQKQIAVSAGKTISMEIWRGGYSRTISVSMGEQEEGLHADVYEQPLDPRNLRRPTVKPSWNDLLGLHLHIITPEMRQHFSLNSETKGVIVTEVKQTEIIEQADITPGDVIIQAGQEPVTSPSEFFSVYEKAQRLGQKRLLVLRDRYGELSYITILVQ